MFARISAFVIWSLVAATAVFWLLRLTSTSPQAPAYAAAVGKSTVVRGDLSRLFGAPPVVVAAVEAQPAAPSRFKLVGVMAPRSKDAQSIAGNGLALIAVDGKAPKAFTVGAALESGLVLQSVGLRTASLGPAQGARSMLLELPAVSAPSTGVLPPTGGVDSSIQPAYPARSLPGTAGLPVPSLNTVPMDVPLPGATGAAPQPGSAGLQMGSPVPMPSNSAAPAAVAPVPTPRSRVPPTSSTGVSTGTVSGIDSSAQAQQPPGISLSPSVRIPANANVNSR